VPSDQLSSPPAGLIEMSGRRVFASGSAETDFHLSPDVSAGNPFPFKCRLLGSGHRRGEETSKMAKEASPLPFLTGAYLGPQ